ncbi:hypothetical protein HDU97_007240 [Phlyctochytrium planicorne]|nr:hypothetical protein HDU97_007240 [Phlyctochytrium planicorne]
MLEIEKKRPSIYDPPEEKYVVIDEPSELELQLRKTRLFVSDAFQSTKSELDDKMRLWMNVEHRLRTSIKEYWSPDEKLLPNMLYVSVAGFGGSILSKNTIATFAYLYPKTTTIIMSKSTNSGISWESIIEKK